MSTRRLGLFAAWVAATILSVVLASQAVGLVRDQVTDRPSRTVSTLLASVTTESTAPLVSTPENIDPQVPERSTTTVPPEPTTTPSTAPAVTPTAPPTTAPPTDAAENLRYTLVGGWVTVACSESHIRFKSAAPKAGFSVERTNVEENKVEVKFESSYHTSRFSAVCSDGSIVESIEESDEHGDD